MSRIGIVRKVLQWLISRLGGQLRTRPVRAWLLQVLPLAVLLSVLTSIGGLLQEHLLTTVRSDAPTLYDAMYSDQIVQFPNLSEWLSLSLTPLYLLLGFIVAHFSLRAGRLWNVVALSAIWTAGMLTLMDLIYLSVSGELTPATMTLNASFNLMGAMLVAFVVGLVLPIYRLGHEAFPDGGAITHYISAAMLVAMGLAISSATYLLITYLYEPVEVRFTAVVDPPVEGSLVPKMSEPPSPSERSDGPHGFDFLPDNPTAGSASISSPGGTPRAVWEAVAPITYDLELRVLASCYKADLPKLQGSPPFLSRRNVRKVVIGFDQGHSLFQVQPQDKGKFQFKQDYPRDYWIKRESRGALEVSYFVSQPGVFTTESAGLMHILAGTLLVEQRERGKAIMGPRTSEILIDGERIPLRLSYVRGRSSGECKPVPVAAYPVAESHAARSPNGVIEIPSAEVSFLMRIAPRERQDGLYDIQASRVTVTEANGWLTVNDLPESELVGADVGEASFVSFKGKPASVEADGKSINANEFDSWVALGDVRGDILSGGHVRFDGKVPVLWRGNTRLNPTRWERLPTEFRFTILGALILFLWGLLRVVWWPAMSRFRDENVNDWLG